MTAERQKQIEAMAVDKYPSPEYDDDSIEFGKQEAYAKGASEALGAADWSEAEFNEWQGQKLRSVQDVFNWFKQNIILNPKNI